MRTDCFAFGVKTYQTAWRAWLTSSGSSYGTILGMTFAAMFPDRVDRMMLDATVNPYEYMAGTSLEMLLDADKAFYAFILECIASNECPLSDPGGNAAALIDTLNDVLREMAIGEKGPELYREFKNDVIYRGLYWPTGWAELGRKLQFINADFTPSTTSTESDSDGSSAEPEFEYNKGSAAVFGTRCADSSLRAQSPDDLAELLLQQAQVSSFADVNTATSLVCAAWRIEPAERYNGNFTAKTRHPILFVNGLFDPAAPVASAQNASMGFDGSRVLLHDGYGVSSFRSMPLRAILT